MTTPEKPSQFISDEELQQLKKAILEKGFHRVGFACADRAPHADHLDEWLARGYAGDMHYISKNRARRQDPRKIVPGAQSVIALAVHYRDNGRTDNGRTSSSPSSHEISDKSRAVISSYAQGDDYHGVLEKRLRATCHFLTESFPDHVFRYYVDTGPVLERSWAEKAGIGWIGKNTCAIDPDNGSYFFIGTIITTLDLPADAPSTNHCDSCRLCIDSCPTSAIVEPYRLDANLCISYQTIENRGQIPLSLRADLATLVFGCDICQEVCPFNQPEWSRTRRLKSVADGPTADEQLTPRDENNFPPLQELALIESEETFRDRFPRSPVRRAKFKGFMRNVILAIGNSGRKDLLPVLDTVAKREFAQNAVIQDALEWSRQRLKV